LQLTAYLGPGNQRRFAFVQGRGTSKHLGSPGGLDFRFVNLFKALNEKPGYVGSFFGR
jgi:hypothetical protein